MLRHLLLLALCPLLTASALAAEPLKALLIAGGCCHDYAKQHEILSKGIQARANVQVDVIWTDDKSTNPPLPLYEKADWAKGYHIIIHDECAASMNNKDTLTRVLDAHKTIPSVHLHCAMHSFRTGEDRWFKHLGLQSNSHGPQEPIAITFVDKEHPVTKSLADWTTIKEELYNNVNVFDAHPLAMGKQTVKNKDGSTKDVEYIVAWTNEKQGARSFSTTIGHNNDTVADARYLDLLSRGVLWACNKLTPEYLTAFKGENKVTHIAAKPAEAPKPKPAPPANATGIKATASSEESGKNNFAWCAVDGDEKTRWCANSSTYPQWLQLELEKPQTLTGIATTWENNGVYQFKVEVSTDGKAWTTLVDANTNEKGAPYSNDFAKAESIRFVKIHALGKKGGGWASIREVTLKGPTITALKPSVPSSVKNAADALAKEGNVIPKIVKLTPEQEAAILKDVKVADGFEVTLFANSAAANYPVYVAAEPDGTLYVSSDGNGSLGRNPKRGRIIRLRDHDNDGRADETKVFCEVDSPRGLVWDHDRLYLVHPPHVSEFIDADHDGVAEKQNILVKDIAFGFKDRPADHTTNGLSLGIDGWLYIAGGDFGFMKATGTDGKTLQHRGGGVIRVRPDGTGLEVYSTGTRNILEVAISPLMDIFARDNTNDGGGWNVRFHHFTGGEDHGYPRLYKNFNDECIQPLADYGGGSGCGAVYIDEPGFGEWNNAPFTADWGTGAIWHHQVKPKGATFEETRKPEPFIKMTRPTDADVDGMSRVYASSWRGATFNWEGPEVGYIVQVKPKGFKAEALPDFAKASDAELAKQLESPSNRRRMEAQRELLRRQWSAEMKALTDTVRNAKGSDESRVAAAYALTQHPTCAVSLMREPSRSTGDYIVQSALVLGNAYRPATSKFDALVIANAQAGADHVGNARFLIASIVAQSAPGASFDKINLEKLEALLSTNDSVVAHSAANLLAKFPSPDKAFAVLDGGKPGVASLALRGLQKMHQPEVVDGLIERLTKATEPTLRQGILAALCRLHFHEGEWKGDSWGTRPDTRGPYYQPEAWSETDKILTTLREALAKAQPEEAAFLVREMNRNRIRSDDALKRILELAKQDPKVIPDAVAQLAVADEVPTDSIPMLVQALKK